jgi:hypothetical protein
VDTATSRRGFHAKSLIPGWGRVPQSAAAVAALVGLANLVVLLAQSSSLIAGLDLDADNASAFVLPALAGDAPAGSIVNLGNHAWYEPWWFMRATAGLPGYRQLWEAAPFFFGLLGIAAVSWCAGWALGRAAGLLCAVALLAGSEALRADLYVPESHGLIVLHVAVLCGALLLVHSLAVRGRLTRRAMLLVAVPLVLFTGAGLTDQLLLVSGLAPFIVAPLACWVRLRSPVWRTVSLFALLTGVLSGLLALLLSHTMQADHVIHAPFPINFVGSESLVGSLQNLFATLAILGGGAFFGTPASGSDLLTFIAGALTLVAFCVALRALWHWIGSSAQVRVRAISPRAESREIFIAYWGSVLVLVVAAFALTSVSSSTDNGRYLLGAWVALAALLGIVCTTVVTRTALMLAVAVFGAVNLRAELRSGVGSFGVGPDQQTAGAIERFALAEGAAVGYSGYWDSAPVTWETHLRIRVYPIEACATPAGVCPFYANQINAWYAPRANTRTFLLTDTRSNVPLAVTSPIASFGKPIAEQAVGEGLTVYVYDYDVASDLGA